MILWLPRWISTTFLPHFLQRTKSHLFPWLFQVTNMHVNCLCKNILIIDIKTSKMKRKRKLQKPVFFSIHTESYLNIKQIAILIPPIL